MWPAIETSPNGADKLTAAVQRHAEGVAQSKR
jgi:hypothetical protein